MKTIYTVGESKIKEVQIINEHIIGEPITINNKDYVVETIKSSTTTKNNIIIKDFRNYILKLK